MITLNAGLGQKQQNGNPWAILDVKLAGIGFATAYMAFMSMGTYSTLISWQICYGLKALYSFPWEDNRPLQFISNDESA